MESPVKFGTMDRFFSDKNEKRIGRVSFFLRMLSLFLAASLLGMAINMWLMNMIGLRMMFVWPTVITFLLWLTLIFSYPVLVKKRSHDFDNNGKILSYIIFSGLLVNLIVNACIFIPLLFWSIESIMQPSMIISIISYLGKWLSIVSLLIIIFLVFKPGTAGANTYWELQK